MAPHTRKVELDRKNVAPANSSASMDPTIEAALIDYQCEFLRFLVRRLDDRDTAMDVLQQFYLRVICRGSEVRKAESALAWLYAVLRTTLVDHYRSETIRRSQEAHYALAQAPSCENWEAEPENRVCACLHKALSTLKPEYSDALQRVDLREAPPHDVARESGIAANTMRVRLHRARLALKRALLRYGGECSEHDCFVRAYAQRPAVDSFVDRQPSIAA